MTLAVVTYHNSAGVQSESCIHLSVEHVEHIMNLNTIRLNSRPDEERDKHLVR